MLHHYQPSSVVLPLPEATAGLEPAMGVLQTPALPLGDVALGGAEDGIRTRGPLLGKQMLYH